MIFVHIKVTDSAKSVVVDLLCSKMNEEVNFIWRLMRTKCNIFHLWAICIICMDPLDGMKLKTLDRVKEHYYKMLMIEYIASVRFFIFIFLGGFIFI